MKGFFSREEIETDFAIQQLENPLPACKKCGMHIGCKHPKTEHSGHGKKKILIIAEANGPDEDQAGRQLVGTVGRWTKDKLLRHGLDLDQDFWKINAVNCFPHDEHGNIRSPTKAEVECCKPMVDDTIRKLNPDFIWLFGNHAVESLYLKEFRTLNITRWRNLCIPDSKYNAWVLPMFHPSYILRNSKDENLEAVFDSDLAYAVDCLDLAPPVAINPRDNVVCLYKIEGVIELLDGIIKRKMPYIVFDYETSGLKPQAPGHKIATVSLMEAGSVKAYSFPLSYAGHFDRIEQVEIKLRLRTILSNPRIGKVAQNKKFEHAWSEFILGVKVRNWKWCTMLCSHILDTRKKYTGLKFQSYINFGVYPYDKHIAQYLKDTTGSGFNKIDDAPLDSLLMYGGMDSWLTHRLYNRQLEEFTNSKRGNRLAAGYKLFHEGNLALCEIQSNGIPMNEGYYAKKDRELSESIKWIYSNLLESGPAKRFQQETGRVLKLKGTSSQKDMKQLFVDILELDIGTTEGGRYSFDEKALLKIDIPFTRDLLKARKLEKIHGTYFAEFKREMCGGKMYPFFDLNGPRSLRSSSSKPNFQNIPIREANAKKACRSGIIPSPGNQLMESDFKGIEVAVAACYTKDPALIEHITNPDNDMHRDAAADLWMLPASEITKDIRFFAKNCWVFPQFYGSYYGNCAEDLWEAVIVPDLQTSTGVFVKDHLADHGLNSLDAFTEHCQSVEDDFWNVRFRVYKQWKNKIQKDYRKKGYFETFFGFRFHGYLTYNQLCNYPIQGTAFHCLLWTLIRLQQEAKSEKWLSKILGQVHDSILWDLHPSELDHIIQRTIQIGTKDIVQENPWINIPFEIEFELAPIDGSWYEKKEIKV